MGRWIAYMGQGRFRHDATAKYNTIHGDLFIGWKAHILRTKKAPIVRLGLSKFGRHKQTRTADLYHVKVAL